MKCEQCLNQWEFADLNSRTVRFCPFCGAKIKKGYDLNKVEGIINHIIDEYGIQVLNNNSKFVALFMDLATSFPTECRLVKMAAQYGICQGIYSIYQKNGEAKDIFYSKALKQLNDEFFLDRDRARQLLDLFFNSFGWTKKREIQSVSEEQKINNINNSISYNAKTVNKSNKVMSTSNMAEYKNMQQNVTQKEYLSEITDITLKNELELFNKNGQSVNQIVVNGYDLFKNNFIFNTKDLNNVQVLIIKNISEIPCGAFTNWTNLKYIYFDSCLQKIESGAFDGCVSLKGMVFYANTHIRDISYQAFGRCNNITWIAVSSEDPVTMGTWRYSSLCKPYDNDNNTVIPQSAKLFIEYCIKI